MRNASRESISMDTNKTTREKKTLLITAELFVHSFHRGPTTTTKKAASQNELARPPAKKRVITLEPPGRRVMMRDINYLAWLSSGRCPQMKSGGGWSTPVIRMVMLISGLKF